MRLQTRQSSIGYAHEERSRHEEFSASEAIDKEDRTRRHEELPRLQTRRDDPTCDCAVMEILLEDCVGVEGDDIDAAHLCEDVDADGDEGAVQVAVGGACEGVSCVALLVEFDGVANDLDAGGYYFGVCWLVFEF